MKHGNYQHGWLHHYCGELGFTIKFQITAPIVPAKGQLQTTECNLCAENEIFFGV